jgi:hypothetical protein
LPEGHYEVRQGSSHTSVTVLPGGTYDVDLRPDRVLDFQVKSQTLGRNEIVLRVSAQGAGRHTFNLRTDNLVLTEPARQEIVLTAEGSRVAIWHAHVVSPNTPWVAVIIPDDKLGARRELTGAETATDITKNR